ncbi:MAG: magnesium transporter CorA family protein [Saprospiraceae bacterium]|nr:magnesium transporter CorA family protein [Saprospiraceae bacterium]
MIRYFGIKEGQFFQQEFLREAHWIHISPPWQENEISQLAGSLDIASDYLTDPLDIEERVRYEKYEEARSIILHTPVYNETEKENDPIYITIPLGIIFTQGKMITVCSQESPILEKFVDMKVRGFDPRNERLFALQIFEQNVLMFLECLKKLNLRRSLIEEELYNSSRSEELKNLLRIEKSLVYFVNSLNANELLKIKVRRTDLLGIKDNEDLSLFFEDIIVDNNQAREVAQLYTNILNGTMEAYTSIISNNLNKFVNRLTVITITLLFPALIAGFFGMNVPIPFGLGHNKYAFFLIVFVSILFSLGITWFFRKKDMI